MNATFSEICWLEEINSSHSRHLRQCLLTLVADLQKVATGATAGPDFFFNCEKIWLLANQRVITNIPNSRVPRMGKFIKELISPVNSDGFTIGKLCIVLFFPVLQYFSFLNHRKRLCCVLSQF